MTGKNLRIYDRNAMTGKLALRETVALDSFADNITIDANDALWIGSHPRLTDFLRHAADASVIAPSQIFKITPLRNVKSRVEEIYLNNGEQISAASVALRHGKYLVLGTVFDSKLLVCTAP
jgi:arylesterase/paraoxonase